MTEHYSLHVSPQNQDSWCQTPTANHVLKRDFSENKNECRDSLGHLCLLIPGHRSGMASCGWRAIPANMARCGGRSSPLAGTQPRGLCARNATGLVNKWCALYACVAVLGAVPEAGRRGRQGGGRTEGGESRREENKIVGWES